MGNDEMNAAVQAVQAATGLDPIAAEAVVLLGRNRLLGRDGMVTDFSRVDLEALPVWLQREFWLLLTRQHVTEGHFPGAEASLTAALACAHDAYATSQALQGEGEARRGAAVALAHYLRGHGGPGASWPGSERMAIMLAALETTQLTRWMARKGSLLPVFLARFLGPDGPGVTRLQEAGLLPMPAARVAEATRALLNRLAVPEEGIVSLGPIDPEIRYLRRYPDVAEALQRGEFPSARAHFEAHGQGEGRVWEE